MLLSRRGRARRWCREQRISGSSTSGSDSTCPRTMQLQSAVTFSEFSDDCHSRAIASSPAERSSRFARWTVGGSTRWRSIYIPLEIAGPTLASQNLPAQKQRLDKARGVCDAAAGNVHCGAVVGRSARKRQSECDIHRTPKRRDFDCGHPYIVIRRDHRVEFAAHRPHENRIGRKRAQDSRAPRGWTEELIILVAEAAAVSGVWIERTKRDSRSSNSKPAREILDGCRRDRDDLCLGQRSMHLAQGNVGCGEYDAQSASALRWSAACGEHHGDTRARELGQHLGVSGITVPPGKERKLIDGRRDNAVHGSLFRQLHRTLDRSAAQTAGGCCIAASDPAPDRLIHLEPATVRTDQQ